MVDPLDKKIDRAVKTMLYRDSPPQWFGILLVSVLVLIIGLTFIITMHTFGGKPQTAAPSGPQTYTPVLRLFMHTPQRISFFVPTETAALELVTMESTAITWIADVPAGQPLYVVRSEVKRRGTMFTSVELAVHIHSVADVSGGSWDNGKSGSGATTVVE